MVPVLRAVRLTGRRQRGLGEFKVEFKFGADACEPIDNLDVIRNPAPASAGRSPPPQTGQDIERGRDRAPALCL